MRLSLCIATFNRAAFIGQTLDALVPQLTPEVELVVVDGASSDGTADVMAAYLARYPQIVYRRQAENSGVDRDFDKAVHYASGDYCWLMSDDDILASDAVATVLAGLSDDPQLLVVNADIRTRNLSTVLKANQLEIVSDMEFEASEHERLFQATASYLSFIGAVVIRRDAWLARDRATYFGTLFIHVGVIFQAALLGRARVIARPLISIRYGNALWTARGFQIWTHNWPRLIWSFEQFKPTSRAGITPRLPAASAKTLLWYRALGAYGPAEYAGLVAAGAPRHWLARALAGLPAGAANAAVALYLMVRRHADARVMLYDLVRARCASGITHWAARRFRFPETER